MPKMDWKSLLCNLLDCGYLDLQMIEDADENYVLEAIDYLKNEGLEISLNGILDTMFFDAKNNLMEAVEARVDVLEENEDELDEDEREELADMRKLNPDEDITWFINWSDSHIYINEDVEAVYRNWFGGLIDDLENKMGIVFE